MAIDLFGLATAAQPDEASARKVAERARKVLRPIGALQRLDELAVWLAGWQQTDRPKVENPLVLIFGGDHGVAAEGVSAYPPSVTAAMMVALRSGTATASVMARWIGARIEMVDVGVGRPTGNIRHEPAMDEAGFHRAIQAGRNAIAMAGTVDVLALGEVGIGNTTPAAAVCLALLGGSATDWVGPGTGLDANGVAHKAQVVAEAAGRISEADPLEVLRELGGWEMAALAGAVMEARQRSIPVLLDGFVVSSAVLPLEIAHPGYLAHCWPAHVSAEPGHRRLVERLGRSPILDLEMRLGEGSGAIAALPLVSLAASSVVDVATFEEAGLV
jgi:nicotinate-nucleotide--dimethylbenzimidazole phosphoribosyltransferase